MPESSRTAGDLLASQAVPALEGGATDLLGARPGPCIETELAVPAGVPLLHARAAERQQPPEIVARDEMPGGSEHVGADE